jgi:hypothetical protein
VQISSLVEKITTHTKHAYISHNMNMFIHTSKLFDASKIHQSYTIKLIMHKEGYFISFETKATTATYYSGAPKIMRKLQ